jgi:hypothetical protein
MRARHLRLRISETARNFRLLQTVHNVSGVHPASSPKVTIVFSVEVKRSARGTFPSPPSSAADKNVGSYTSTSSILLHGATETVLTLSLLSTCVRGRKTEDLCVKGIAIYYLDTQIFVFVAYSKF